MSSESQHPLEVNQVEVRELAERRSYDEAKTMTSKMVARAVHHLRNNRNQIFRPPFDRQQLRDITVNYIDQFISDCRAALTRYLGLSPATESTDSGGIGAFIYASDEKDCRRLISTLETIAAAFEEAEMRVIEDEHQVIATLKRIAWEGTKADLERALDHLKPLISSSLSLIYEHFTYRDRITGERKNLEYTNGESRRHAKGKESKSVEIKELERFAGKIKAELN